MMAQIKELLLSILPAYVILYIPASFKKYFFMKKIILVTISFITVASTNAQQPVISNPFPKTITVNGSAEMEIIPDEIYVNITLKEYQKRGGEKKDIETIKKQFLESCEFAGIADSVISIYSYAGYNSYYWQRKRKKDANLSASITYQVKFKSSNMMDALVDKLDDDATQSFLIVSTSHSKITEFRKQLKIQAIKAAKDKASYLAESIGEKPGMAISISEPNEINLYNNSVANENIRIRGISSYGYFQKDSLEGINNDNVQEVDFKKMKLRYEVTVVFALQ